MNNIVIGLGICMFDLMSLLNDSPFLESLVIGIGLLHRRRRSHTRLQQTTLLILHCIAIDM